MSKDNNWSCLLNAFARVLNERPSTLIKEIGHDGSEIVFPDLPSKFKRASFHPRELIDCCLARGYTVTQIERYPFSRTLISENKHAVNIDPEKFFQHLSLGDGVLTGFFDSTQPHAVPWIDGCVIDDNGERLEGLGDFVPRIFFLIVKGCLKG